eukprot:1194581-Prorocentrum_minimum.AAC.5
MFVRTGRKLVEECGRVCWKRQGLKQLTRLENIPTNNLVNRLNACYPARAFSTALGDAKAQPAEASASVPTSQPEPEFASGTTVNVKEARKFQEVADLWCVGIRVFKSHRPAACFFGCFRWDRESGPFAALHSMSPVSNFVPCSPCGTLSDTSIRGFRWQIRNRSEHAH